MIISALVTFSLIHSTLAIVADPYTNGPEYPVKDVPAHGQEGFKKLTADWKKIPMPSPSPIVIPIKEIAVGNFKPLEKVMKGELQLHSLVFYGLDESDEDGYPGDKTGSSYDIEGRIVKRYYGYLGKKVDAFQGKAKLKGEKGDKECLVVGLSRHMNATSREEKVNYIYFYFDYSVTSKPFSAVRSNQFDIFPHQRRSKFALYLDPECAEIHQRYLEMFSYATESSSSLQSAIRQHIKSFVSKFYHKYLIEPHRYSVEGAI